MIDGLFSDAGGTTLDDFINGTILRDATFPDLSGIPDFWPAEQPFRIFSIFVCYHGYSSAAKPELQSLSNFQ